MWHHTKKSPVIRQKGRISKRVLQENKSCQIFQKTKISYPPPLLTRACVHQGVRNVCFLWKICCTLFSCYTRFKIRPFALLSVKYSALSTQATHSNLCQQITVQQILTISFASRIKMWVLVNKTLIIMEKNFENVESRDFVHAKKKN